MTKTTVPRTGVLPYPTIQEHSALGNSCKRLHTTQGEETIIQKTCKPQLPAPATSLCAVYEHSGHRLNLACISRAAPPAGPAKDLLGSRPCGTVGFSCWGSFLLLVSEGPRTWVSRSQHANPQNHHPDVDRKGKRVLVKSLRTTKTRQITC